MAIVKPNSDKVSLMPVYKQSASLRQASKQCATGEISRQNNSWTMLLFDVHAATDIAGGGASA